MIDLSSRITYFHCMKQLFIYISLSLFLTLSSLAQNNSNIPCNDELYLAGQPTSFDKAKSLDENHGFEEDSLQILFDDNEIIKDGRAYVYIINTKKHDVFFREAHPFLPQTAPIIQEALDSNGNWVPVEYLMKNNECFYPQMEFLRPDSYIAFTKKIYKEGDVCTKIRFKFTARDQIYYSEAYDGCVHQCQIDNSLLQPIVCDFSRNKDDVKKIIQICQIPVSIDKQIAQIKELYNENWDKRKKEIFLKALLSLYRKQKDYETAFSYADQLEKMNTGSGKCYLYKGDLYAMSAKQCFNELFEQKVVIIAAMEEWEKAKQFSDSKEQAEKQIRLYTPYLPERPSDGLYNKDDTYHIRCWINKTVQLWKY